MKKYTSTALLALQLTWKTVLAVFLAAGIGQFFALYRELMPGGVPLQTTFGFETIVRESLQTPGMLFIPLLAFLLQLRSASSKGSKGIYTLNRLGLSELHLTLVFGLVFTGYFLLYWAFQLLFAYGAFVWYCRFSLVSSNAFMLAVWRSEWLHTLLPLAEWWGWLCNLSICLSFGFFAAYGSAFTRHGKPPLAPLLPAVLCFFLLSGRIGESFRNLGLTVLLLGLTVGTYFALKEETINEDL